MAGIRKKLIKCIQYKDKWTGDATTAILHSYNKDIFMFFVIRESAIDGIEYVGRKHIKRLASKSKYVEFINNCIAKGLIRIPNAKGITDEVKLQDVIKTQKEIIGIDTIYKDESIFLVGRVGNFENKKFEIECVDVQGNADEFKHQIKYSEVTRLSVGGNYLKMLNKWNKTRLKVENNC